jgi:hypothetical protein
MHSEGETQNEPLAGGQGQTEPLNLTSPKNSNLKSKSKKRILRQKLITKKMRNILKF